MLILGIAIGLVALAVALKILTPDGLEIDFYLKIGAANQDGEPDFDEDDADLESGTWEACPACEGSGKNEHGQACAWCKDSPYPGTIPHKHEGD